MRVRTELQAVCLNSQGAFRRPVPPFVARAIAKDLFQLLLKSAGVLDRFKQPGLQTFRFAAPTVARPSSPPKEVKNQQANEHDGEADGNP